MESYRDTAIRLAPTMNEDAIESALRTAAEEATKRERERIAARLASDGHRPELVAAIRAGEGEG